MTAIVAKREEFFGWDVGVSGGSIFVSAVGGDAAGTLTGTVYAFIPEPNRVLLQLAVLMAIVVLRARSSWLNR